jgi:hypothetical protein
MAEISEIRLAARRQRPGERIPQHRNDGTSERGGPFSGLTRRHICPAQLDVARRTRARNRTDDVTGDTWALMPSAIGAIPLTSPHFPTEKASGNTSPPPTKRNIRHVKAISCHRSINNICHLATIDTSDFFHSSTFGALATFINANFFSFLPLRHEMYVMQYKKAPADLQVGGGLSGSLRVRAQRLLSVSTAPDEQDTRPGRNSGLAWCDAARRRCSATAGISPRPPARFRRSGPAWRTAHRG